MKYQGLLLPPPLIFSNKYVLKYIFIISFNIISFNIISFNIMFLSQLSQLVLVLYYHLLAVA